MRVLTCAALIDGHLPRLPLAIVMPFTLCDTKLYMLCVGQYYRLNMEYLPEGPDVISSLKVSDLVNTSEVKI